MKQAIVVAPEFATLLITMANGRELAIEDIAIGDQVLADEAGNVLTVVGRPTAQDESADFERTTP